MSTRRVEIDEQLYLRAAAKATQENTTLTNVIEGQLRDWVGPIPAQPVTSPTPKSPTTTRTRVETYTVRYGDTLAQIARRFYGDAKQYTRIAGYNGITNPAMIRVGQVLRIPFTETVPADAHTQPPSTEPEAQSQPRPFRFPLNKIETNYYKFGSLYAASSRWAGKPHPGVDFHEYKGANVYAIGGGTVVINKQDPTGYGHYIMIEHTLPSQEKVYSLYGHLMYDDDAFQSPLVGAKLRGEDIVIGKEGDTGYAGVPHVHFEVKKTSQLGLYSMITTYNLNEYFYDPYTFIRQNRYLPVT
jgi:murein DD-endopeptidase MepM/ murein hydrolase activator NlpD